MVDRNSPQQGSATAQSESRDDLQRTRQLLFDAHAIIQVSIHALDSKLEGLDETSVIDALQVAGRLIDNVAAAMEGVRC